MKTLDAPINELNLSDTMARVLCGDVFSGRVFTLGRADYGRLGHGEEGKELSEPTLVAALQENRCTQIGAGGCVSLAVTEKGEILIVSKDSCVQPYSFLLDIELNWNLIN